MGQPVLDEYLFDRVPMRMINEGFNDVMKKEVKEKEKQMNTLQSSAHDSIAFQQEFNFGLANTQVSKTIDLGLGFLQDLSKNP